MSQLSKYDLFINMIQAAMIVAAVERRRGAGWVAQVVAEAMFVPEDALPDDLTKVGKMALEFIKWQCEEFTPQPGWYKLAWVGDKW